MKQTILAIIFLAFCCASCTETNQKATNTSKDSDTAVLQQRPADNVVDSMPQ